MKTTLKTNITVKDICEGFVYNAYKLFVQIARWYLHRHLKLQAIARPAV